MTKRPFACSHHAKQRAEERLGIPQNEAHSRLMNYMQTADFRGATSNSRIFDHYKSRTRIVLDPLKDVKLRKANAIFRRTYRQYTLRLADINLEIAELFRNKVRCKHPGTQALIQAQIDGLESEARAIQDAMQTQESEYRAVEDEAKAYMGATEMEVAI